MWTFPDRSNSLLSGEDIINFRQNSLKDIPAGSKDYAPDNSWLEQKQIQATLETHHSLLSAQRIEKKSNLSLAEWRTNVGKAKVTKKAGKHWEVFGHTINSEDWLLPEEALFLLETNALELYLEEVPLSVEQTYALIIGDIISLSDYRVYSHLSRKGYRVLRHDKEISVTPYEKDIHADQVSLAAKRPIPGVSSEPNSSKKVGVDKDEPGLVDSEGVSVSKYCSENVASGENLDAVASVNSKEARAAESVSSKDAHGAAASVSLKDPHGAAVSASRKDAHGAAASLSSKDTHGAAAPVSSKDPPGTLASVSPKDTVGSEASATSSGTLARGHIASDCNSGNTVSVGSNNAEPTLKDLSSETNGIRNFLETSCTQISLSVPQPSSQVDLVSQEEFPSNSKLESEVQNPIAKSNASISRVQELISVDSEGSVGDDTASVSNVIVEMPDENVGEPSKAPDENREESMNIDDSSSEDAFPGPATSPDLVIVEAEDQIIEIADDEPSSEDEDEDDVMIMDVRKPNKDMDTVDLLDSDEDEDVVFICRKPSNTDPSKWRKWFLTTTEFVNYKFQETPEESTKIPKVKLIDLFDLGQKSYDSIWKAIPRHDGNDEFINAPDQRFIPSTILPKFAQYRISLHQRAVSPRSENRTPANVDTSRNLNEIVQYGREPSYFSRNEGYSFHRSRNYIQNAPWFTSNATRPPRNQMFGENHQPSRFNNSYQGPSLHQGPSFRSLPQTNDQSQQRTSNSNQNQNYNRNRFGNHGQNRSYGNFDNRPSVQRPTNFQPQGNFAPNEFGNSPNQFGGVNNEGLKVAVMQACQMQMLAMGLMQSCQALMQQVPGFMNPLNNMNVFPMNNLLGSNLVGNFNQQPQQQYQYNRGHRPYRRPWRGGQGRRRYYNDDRSGPPKVTEIPVPPNRENREKEKYDVVSVCSDGEDKKDKPAIKRNLALNAIASLNKPKKAKLKITTDVKSIKIDTSEPSGSIIIDLDDVSSVKSESPCPSPKSQDVFQRKEKRVTDVSPLAVTPACAPARTGRMAENAPARSKESAPIRPKESALVHSEQRVHIHPEESVQAHSMLDVSEDSRPSYIVYDEQVSVDSDSGGFAFEKYSEAAAGNVGSSSRTEPMEVTDSSGAVPVSETLEDSSSRPTPTENAEGSWKAYKEQEQSIGDVQPKLSGALVSIDNERSDIKDVMKSLQVIGPIDDAVGPRDELRVSYDVYLPNQPFRKSIRLLPNYRVIIAKSECFPTIFELNYLEATYRDNVPFLYAVVTLDAIRLYNLRSVSLPTLVPDV